MFINLNKIGNLQFGGAVTELLFGKATTEEYNRLDLGVRDNPVKLLGESVLQVINYDSKTSFY